MAENSDLTRRLRLQSRAKIGTQRFGSGRRARSMSAEQRGNRSNSPRLACHMRGNRAWHVLVRFRFIRAVVFYDGLPERLWKNPETKKLWWNEWVIGWRDARQDLRHRELSSVSPGVIFLCKIARFREWKSFPAEKTTGPGIVIEGLCLLC